MTEKKRTPVKKTAKVKQSTGKFVYFFGGDHSEGHAGMRSLLGGKGANLAEMAELGLPVPPGFTITTEACAKYYELGEKALHQLIDDQILAGLKKLEMTTGKTFGKGKNPLLVSVRSGAAASMPGMRDTVLNLGFYPETVEAMIAKSGNARFVWDSYRRFIQMFGNVVMGIEHDLFEHELDMVKQANNYKLDTELTVEDLQEVVKRYTTMVKRVKKCAFPTDAMTQLMLGINAVFGSWNNARAIKYRALNDIRGLLGTAVNVQAMVFGNSGPNSATGVAFTRDPSTGEHKYFYGEYLINAQGEDVVAGIRTPQQITLKGSREWAKARKISESERKAKYPALEESMPDVFKQLDAIRVKLEKHYHDMQDLEFTIEDGRLFMLQTRNGKRTAAAAVRIAMDLVKEKLIDEKTAVMRVVPNQLDQLLHPVFVKSSESKAVKITMGLPASPGAATGQIVFDAATAEAWASAGKHVILCRTETSPEDIGGMNVSEGILTARGGMTSHAAVVARGMGKCCISGCGEILINMEAKTLSCGETVLKEGDWISLNGSTGLVYNGKVETEDPKLAGPFAMIMKLADKYRKLGIRTNADTPRDTVKAVAFGAEGIGLCRTEHMFFQGERIVSFRRMILVAETVKRLRSQIAAATDPDEAKKLEKELVAPLKQFNQALKELLPLQRKDFKEMFMALKGRPCTIRLLDPPLHEFLPQKPAEQAAMAKTMGTDVQSIQAVVEQLHEANPMLGHRGCRLGISYPEVTEMQVRAICEAAALVKDAQPEIMVPLVGNVKELISQKKLINQVKETVEKEKKITLNIKIGTMIEVPRAAITADQIAQEADFFSFGTNDLTQMTCAFSRDDAAKFLGDYVATGFYDYDPFQVLDTEGVGRMIHLAIQYGRGVKPHLKIGVCGEHGGDPKTIAFCHDEGFSYVSCSPYRVPIARLAAAQAALSQPHPYSK
ncbi:MAG: pyruvate, phosphate dikinase [Kiritimatiellae bacterium]|nr:pyruvate, phosphate dikinase [Kiritimatiellia bacterium]